MTQQLNVTIHPDVYLGQFQQQIAAHLTNLRATLRSIEDGSIIERAKISRPGAVINLELGTPRIEPDEAIVKACSRCFLDVTRSLITYMDRIIATKRCTGAVKIEVPSEVNSQEDFSEFFENYLEDQYQAVAKDTSLTNPKKVNELVNLKEYERGALLSYFQLRRCLEHHDAVASNDITVQFTRFFISAAGNEITTLPFTAPENTSIEGQFERKTLVFPKGAKIALTEADIENICLTLQLFIGPNV